jgi:hypothetical protein
LLLIERSLSEFGGIALELSALGTEAGKSRTGM